MWGHLCTELTNLYNFNVSFSTHKSEVLIHLSQWQYWWWFWFSYFWTFYFFIILRSIKHRVFKMNIRLNTSFRSRGKWGDYLVTLIPLSWCMNILLNSNFILRMIEWQSESGSLIIRIHGKQWYWIYKYDLANVMSLVNTPKNIGNNRWVTTSLDGISANNKYIQETSLKIRTSSQQEYWGEVAAKDINPVSSFKLSHTQGFSPLNNTNSAFTLFFNENSNYVCEEAFNFSFNFNIAQQDTKHLDDLLDDLVENSSFVKDFSASAKDNFLIDDHLENITIQRPNWDKIAKTVHYDPIVINESLLNTFQGVLNFDTDLNFNEFFDFLSTTEQDFTNTHTTKVDVDFDDNTNQEDSHLFNNILDYFGEEEETLENITIQRPNWESVAKTVYYDPITIQNNLNTNTNLYFYDNNAVDDSWEVYSNVQASEFKTPVRFFAHYTNQQFFDALKIQDLVSVKFFDSNNTIVEKPEENVDFVVIKQKRYKRKQNISNYWVKNNDVNVEWQPVKKLAGTSSTARFLHNNSIIQQITGTGASNSFDFYSSVKLNRTRSESFSVNLSRRLLRTTRTLVLPAYTSISIIANSYDVVHSWFIPGLGLKIDCVPGKSTHHSLYIDNVGLYYGQCAEICGRYHHHMPIRVCALPFEHFLIWWVNKGLPKSTRTKYNAKKVENVLLLKYRW